MPEWLTSHGRAVLAAVSIARTVLSLALVTALFAPLEHLFAVRRTRLFYDGWATNLGWYFVNGLAGALLLGPPTALIAWAVHTLLPADLTTAASQLPLWPRMALAMIVGEIGFYWGHRWSHEIPWLWRFHAIHHSAEHLNYLVNTRAHPIDMVFGRLPGLALLYATGLASPVGPHPTLIPAAVLFVGSLWSYFIHANVKWRLGPLEWVISTPAFHHWHHTRQDHKDKNYASMLPIMDWVFGTLYLPKTWPADYGVSTPMPPTLTGQLLAPFALRPQLAASGGARPTP
jgi:sterol desaturase/sphingolipid hydroxylase (fatty acid hydroxylase superfamily)